MIGFKTNRQEEKETLLDDKYYLWRFVDLHKLLHFLLTQDIVFSRLDSFEDPMEGLSLTEIEHLDHLTTLPDKTTINPSLGKDVIKEMLKAKKELPLIIKQYQKNQKFQFASCWYKNSSQSWAMWNQYSNKDGFVIRINGKQLLERLTLALNIYHYKNKSVMDAMIGLVEYLPLWPFNKEVMFKYNRPGIYSAFKKDLSYNHENELRLVVVLNKILKTRHLSLNLSLDRDLDIKVFANPKMEDWKYKTFRDLLAKLDIKNLSIEKSELAFRNI